MSRAVILAIASAALMGGCQSPSTKLSVNVETTFHGSADPVTVAKAGIEIEWPHHPEAHK